jgi:hypothetical protein
MNKTSKKNKTTIVLCLLILTMMVNISAAENEPGPCEYAFLRCFQDPLWKGAATEGLFHCALGYAFCKKYIDSVKGF